jgi:DNA mismatch repair protein MutS2
VSSPLGRGELAKVQPHSDRARLDRDLAEASEAIEYLRNAAKPQPAQRGSAIRIDFGGLPELTATVHKLRIEGATLEPRELFDTIALLDRAADAKSILAVVSERFPLLGVRGAALGDFRELLHMLEGKILPDGSVADTASVALGRLRRDIDRQKKQIQESLERFLRAHRDDGILQEEIVTIRNERFVVPVISGQRRKMNGVIHGASSSGHTLFVEPIETIDLNNELVRLAEEEMREVHRILRELTEKLRAHAGAIGETLRAMSELELIFAKGKFALDFDCCIPKFSGRLLLRDARHPLLMDVLRKRGGRVNPIGLTLGADCKTLLISGPNTGGKTVTLKTVGIVVLMAQSGLPVPCAEAELPVFEQLLADIGDHQSIQASLSTFSAHMSHIREMALDVTPDSLVLLDEIGSSTDPEEGGALGVALVDHFRAAGAYTLATTHLLALKIYGANTKSVLNASMGFDEETLQPTYELRLGLPGKSAGLDIAARLGMPEDIMKRARAALSDRERDVSKFLSDLHERLAATTALEQELRRRQSEFEERQKRMTAEAARSESAKIQELEERYAGLQARFEEQARETLDRMAEKAADKAQRSVSKVKREMREEFEAAVLPKAAETVKALRIEPGARVRLKDVREPAAVLRLLGDDRVEVQAGFMKMQVARGDVVEVLPAGGAAARLPAGVTYKSGPQLAPIFQELNVIGERAEEARDRVEKFLDDAVMATASRVRIVHGHGMGVLKKMIGELLARNPHVEKYYAATQSEGGSGATIAELKN